VSIVAECIAPSSPIVNTGDLVADCAAASGTVGWVESTGGLPELSLADGGAIAGAMLALWAVAWAIRAIKKQLEDS